MINRRRAIYAESLALRRELGDPWGLAQSLDNLGAQQLADGDFAAAHTTYVAALEIARQTGDRRLIATELSGLASLAVAHGDVSRAVTLYAEALPLGAELHDHGVGRPSERPGRTRSERRSGGGRRHGARALGNR